MLSALLVVALVFAIAYWIAGSEVSEGEQMDAAEFLEARLLEAKRSISADDTLENYMNSGIVGEPATYHSKRAGKRMGAVTANLGRGLYELSIVNSIGEIVKIHRRRENFQLV